jgi:hypothetical protein
LLSITITNTQDNQFIKRKVLFWLTVLEVPDHNCCFFGPVVRYHIMVGACEEKLLTHGKEAKKEGTRVP